MLVYIKTEFLVNNKNYIYLDTKHMLYKLNCVETVI